MLQFSFTLLRIIKYSVSQNQPAYMLGEYRAAYYLYS